MPSALDSILKSLPAVAQAAAGSDVSSVFTALGRSQVGRVEVRSQFSAPVVVNDPLAPAEGPPQEPNWLMRLLKPEVRVYGQDGQLVIAVAPAGEPTENYLPWLIGGTVVLVVGAWVAGAFVLRRVLK